MTEKVTDPKGKAMFFFSQNFLLLKIFLQITIDLQYIDLNKHKFHKH